MFARKHRVDVWFVLPIILAARSGFLLTLPKYPIRMGLSALPISWAPAHNSGMSTLSGSSTNAEVWAAYDDNASYREDASRSKADAFNTACTILARRLPISAGRDGQSVSRESLQAQQDKVEAWLAANPGSSGSGSTRVRFGDFQDFRD